jgi:hypothetical protein
VRSAIGVVKIAPPEVEKRVVRLRELSATPATPSGATIKSRNSDNRDADSDKKRLADLEKKLDKLLDEVATLKKDRAK